MTLNEPEHGPPGQERGPQGETPPEAAPLSPPAKNISHDSPPWEPSAWLREWIAKAMTELPASAHTPGQITIRPLTDWGLDVAGTPRDRSCDRCEVEVPPTADGAPIEFFVGALPEHHPLTGAMVVLAFGFCRSCAELEGMDTGDAA